MSADDAHNERLVKIELLLMQLQHDVDQLSKELCDQQAEIDSVRRAVKRLAAVPEDDLDEEERPPHY